MDKILTLIIPTYNMEKYLAYCLDSLLIDKPSLNLLEVLVINDGSRDSSSEIAHEYAGNFPDVFHVIDKENGNYGSCINRGLAEAIGKYVKVLDADDCFDTGHFESFITFLSSVDADLVMSDFAITNEQRDICKIISYGFGGSVYYDINDICTTEVFRNGIQMHAVAYRRDCLLDIGYRQTEGISYTDQQWIFIPMTGVRRVAYFNKYVYKYLVGREGQTVDPAVKLRSIKHAQLCAIGMIDVYEHHKSRFKGTPIQVYLDARLFSYAKSVYVSYFTHYDKNARRALGEYDEQMCLSSTEVYDIIGSKEMSSVMGFPYIASWRRHKSVKTWVVKCFSRAYLFLLYLKKVLKPKDKMGIPASV